MNDMENPKFTIITSRCVPLPVENVDTDQIIPARFLKVTSREGFGENLFRDWRFDAEGNNFVVPVVVSDEFLAELFSTVQADPATEVSVDLPAQTVENLATGRNERFDINPYKKQCLVEGLDDIGYLLSHSEEIDSYESNNNK